MPRDLPAYLRNSSQLASEICRQEEKLRLFKAAFTEIALELCAIPAIIASFKCITVGEMMAQDKPFANELYDQTRMAYDQLLQKYVMMDSSLILQKYRDRATLNGKAPKRDLISRNGPIYHSEVGSWRQDGYHPKPSIKYHPSKWEQLALIVQDELWCGS